MLVAGHPDSSDHEMRVLYGDTDQMGIVYHVNYFKYLEAGRVELLRDRSWAYADMEKSGIRIPVLKAEAEYHAPAFYDDLIRIRTRIIRLTRVRLEFEYEVFCDERDQKLATGKTSHAFTGTDNKVKRVDQSVIDRILAT